MSEQSFVDLVRLESCEDARLGPAAALRSLRRRRAQTLCAHGGSPHFIISHINIVSCTTVNSMYMKTCFIRFLTVLMVFNCLHVLCCHHISNRPENKHKKYY